MLFKLKDIIQGETERDCCRINREQLVKWEGVQRVVVRKHFFNFIKTSLIFTNITLTFNNYNIISNIIFIVLLS